MGGHTCLKNLPRNLLSKTQTSVFASSSSISKTSKRCSSSKTPWQSSLHSVVGLEVETGWLHPPTDNQTQPQVNHVSSVLALHASGCSYKQWDKMGALLACPLVAPNMFGYGQSEPWPSNRDPDITDFVALLTSANAPTPTHLIGHSMGGGIALAAAGTSPELKLSSISVFEPNLFSLLAGGGSEDQEVLNEALKFFEGMLDYANREAWEQWGQLFHAFWFDDQGSWNRLADLEKQKLVGSTVPHTVHEIKAIMSTMDKGEEYAEEILDSLSKIAGPKRVVIGNGRCLARNLTLALAQLLQNKAGFQVVHAPVGGHMGPLTHPHQVLPLLLPETVARPNKTFSFK